MSCFHPITAYRGAGGAIVFDKVKSLTGVSMQLPCGRCIGCRMEKARQWGMRCLHEKKMWRHNCYVTLTYSDEHLPSGRSVCLRDVQLFMKRLRKAKGSTKENPLRFFLGAEYGDENKRPHYHALLFNCKFGDMKVFGKNMRGEVLYVSDELASLWGLGHCTIGEVTFDSAVYCAKYALKKVNGDMAMSHYEFVDIDGVVHDRKAEFACMSRRPGIGRLYYDKFGAEVRSLDNVVIDGREVRPPRYYDIQSERLDAGEFMRHKRRRKRYAVLNKGDNTPERLRVKEIIAVRAAERKERKL